MQTIISGIISGIIASGIISIVLFIAKPKIEVSDCICVNPSDGKHRVKIVNCSRFPLLNLEYTMRLCTQRGDDVVEIEEIRPEKSLVKMIERYSPRSANHTYALRISYNLSDYFPLKDDQHFHFTVCARHSFTNAVRQINMSYNQSSLKTGHFCIGKSMKVVHPST